MVNSVSPNPINLPVTICDPSFDKEQPWVAAPSKERTHLPDEESQILRHSSDPQDTMNDPLGK